MRDYNNLVRCQCIKQRLIKLFFPQKYSDTSMDSSWQPITRRPRPPGVEIFCTLWKNNVNLPLFRFLVLHLSYHSHVSCRPKCWYERFSGCVEVLRPSKDKMSFNTYQNIYKVWVDAPCICTLFCINWNLTPKLCDYFWERICAPSKRRKDITYIYWVIKLIFFKNERS